MFLELLKRFSAIWKVWGELLPPPVSVDLAGTVTNKRADYPWAGRDRFYIRISRTEFGVSERLYELVNEGDEAVLTLSGRTPVEDMVKDLVQKLNSGKTIKAGWDYTITLERGTSSTAQRLSALEDSGAHVLSDLEDNRVQRRAAQEAQDLQQLADAECAALQELGIDARALDRDPLPLRPAGSGVLCWIEIAESPIRWISVSQQTDVPYEFYVPDARISPDFPQVTVRAEIKSVQSFPLFGRRTFTGARWDWCELHRGSNEKRSLAVAERLTQNTGLEEAIKSLGYEDLYGYFHISSGPARRCWVLSLVDRNL